VELEMSAAQTPGRGRELQVAIRKSFGNRANEPGFVLDTDFSAAPGFTILFGPSGSGKTTLLDCIAGLRHPDSGRVAMHGELLFDAQSGVKLPAHRRRVGYLLQSPALFPHLTVEENVGYGLHGLPRAEREERSREILESFRIAALGRRRPAQLSGGERQRVALARTLVLRPRALLLDEPLTALDAKVKSQIVDDLRAWNEGQKIPILYVTHQREEVFALGERVLALDEGKIVAQGSAHDVLQRPVLETVAQLAGFENVLECSFVAAHPEQGTMTCRVAQSCVDLEVPLSRIDQSSPLRVGIRAGDILLASAAPQGLSARNIVPGTIARLRQRDVMLQAIVDCGVKLEVHITPAARDALGLQQGARVWLVVKTYSCQVWQGSG
jgi:molybdate transport system ATP-binding protein